MRRIHWIDILALLYVAFVLYGSLIPFDFTLDPQTENVRTFFRIPIVHLSLPDAMSNIALYFPFGLLICGFLRRRGTGFLTTLPLVAIATVLISFSMEFTQIYIASRVASLGDILCNLIGAGMGIAAYSLESALGRGFLPLLNRQLRRDPAAVVAGGCCAMVALAAWAPLDLTFDVPLIGRALGNGYYIPFERDAVLSGLAGEGNLDTLPGASRVAEELWQLRIDYVTDVVLFALLGGVIVRYLRSARCGDTSLAGVACVVTTVLAVLITACGLFVRSVGFDVTHILTRTLGGMLGVLSAGVADRVVFGRANERSGLRAPRMHWAIIIGIMLSGAYIAARELVPFRFDADLAASKVNQIEWLPARSYSLAKLPAAALDASHKLFRFLSLGALMAFWWLSNGMRAGKRECILCGLVTGFAMIPLECAQCFLPGRVPAVTDVLLAAIAAAGGVCFASTGHRWYRRASSNQEAEQELGAMFNVAIPQPSPDSPEQDALTRRRKRRNVKT